MLQSSIITGLKGTLQIPGDKSISHRALILGSQCIGQTRIRGLLESADVLNTAESLRRLGVRIEKRGSDWLVDGVGVGGLSAPEKELDCGNAGTGARLLMGLVAPYEFPCTFVGDESLRRRPMQRVITPLREMGAQIQARDGQFLPLTLQAGPFMVPIEYKLPVASAQVKSCILLAGLNIPGHTTVVEPEATRDHTERMLKALGATLELGQGGRITLHGQPHLKAQPLDVPADPSSAAFFVVAALITPDSDITLTGICMNPLRTGLFEVLQLMGGKIDIMNQREQCGETVADIRVRSSALTAITVPPELAPSMIDEYPILCIAAACAEGTTRMEGIGELKVKESNRVQSMIDGLESIGVEAEEGEDWMQVQGGAEFTPTAPIETHHDHRIAMAFLVAGLVSKTPVEIDDASMIATSFPNFVELMHKVGGKIS